MIVHGLDYRHYVTTTNIEVYGSDVDGFAVPFMLYPKVLLILQSLSRGVLFTIEEYLKSELCHLHEALECFDAIDVALELF